MQSQHCNWNNWIRALPLWQSNRHVRFLAFVLINFPVLFSLLFFCFCFYVPFWSLCKRAVYATGCGSFHGLLLMGFCFRWITNVKCIVIGFWQRIKTWTAMLAFAHYQCKRFDRILYARCSLMRSSSTVAGWTIQPIEMFCSCPFVYQWCWIWCFYATSCGCCSWNYEHRLDHKVEPHHGIYCKHFGKNKRIFVCAVFVCFLFFFASYFSLLVWLCHFHSIIHNQHLFWSRACALFEVLRTLTLSSIHNINCDFI